MADGPDVDVEAADAPRGEVAVARGREAELVGQIFDGKFLIRRLIGIGGFGAVYAARDLALECDVAIKILHREFASNERNRAGFLEEVRRLTRLKHPNIVGWKALARTPDGTSYFVMELLEGRDLLELLRRERTLPPLRAARILLQIFDALRAAHRLPGGECLLHLDLKPSNIFLEPHPSGRRERDWVKVIDFGISQYLDVRSDATPPRSGDAPEPERIGRIVQQRSEASTEATRMNAPVAEGRVRACTPDYASPEQGAHFLEDQTATALDERTDLYSVGVIGFRMLTGRLPFDARTDRDELLREKLTRDPPSVSEIAPKVPRRLARLIDRCIQRDRALRPPDAAAAHRALDAFVHPRFGARAVALGVAVAVMLTLSGWLVLPKGAPPRFDLFEMLPDQDRLVTGERLCFGPDLESRELRVAGVDLAPNEAIRITSDPSPASPPLAAWHATAIDGSRVQIRVDAPPERVVETAYLEVVGANRQFRYSQPLALAWIPADAVRIVTCDVAGRGGRLVDPLDERLRIEVDAHQEDIDRVEVAYGSRSIDATLDPATRDPVRPVYTIPLRSFELRPPQSDLRVRVLDRAGGVRNAAAAIDLVPAALSFVRPPEIAPSQRVGSRWFVRDLEHALLSFELTNVADVEAVLLDEEGAPIARRTFRRTSAGALPLSEFEPCRRGRDFSAAIELHAVDGDHVLRSDPVRGDATARVDLFTATCPNVAVALCREGGARSHVLGANETWFTASRRIEVHVTRDGAIPVRVAVRGDGAVADVDGAEPEATLVGPSDRDVSIGLEFASDGVHDLSIRCWRFVDDADRERAPDLEWTARCVVDGSPPVITVTPVESDETSGATNVWPARAELQLADASNGDGAPPTPAHLRFEIARADRPLQALLDGGFSGTTCANEGVPLRMPWPIDDAAAPLPDGRYVLRAFAEDEAGNVARPVELPFEVAATGPTIEFERPTSHLAWRPESDGRFEVRAFVEDANGVASATATLAVPDLPPVEVPLVADGVSRGGTCAEWAGHVRIPRSWVHREVELRCEARDARGRATTVEMRREATSIECPSPDRVVVRRAGRELGPLRLVRGNHAAPYVFGGRSDETEEKLFAAVGLGTYSRLRLQKSWEVPFANGAIGDYYLDEREVTVAEFRDFLDDPAGYVDRAWWTAGASPDATRRAELVVLLEDAPADRPVAGVDWDEAAAFARWSGKRLPSFVEWEYALRGGPLYRATASGAVVGGQGEDVAPDTGIRDLTGSVAEWSATPARARETGSPAALAIEHPEWFLVAAGPAESSTFEEFWVVGGSSLQERGDFSTARPRPRRGRRTDVGFRCAASLEDVIRSLETREPDRPAFSEEAVE